MTIPSKENILRFHGRSFYIRHDRIHYADESGYHVHPEMELAILKGGGGCRVVNGEEEDFSDLDVVFVPGNFPHCWIFDGARCQPSGMVDDYCCQFNPSLFTALAQLYPEFSPMADFFVSLRQAIQISGHTARVISEMFADILALSEIRQVIRLLEVFNLMYESREFRTIGMPVSAESMAGRSRGRLHMIDRIITENFHRKITLDEVASAVGMGTTAFCNAFKSMTGTTFIRYLTDYRMRIASRLLYDTSLNISEIGYRVGYSDVAHFTRAFSAHYKMSPSVFRRKKSER